MSPRVHEAPTPTPDPQIRVNLHRAGANWAANRAKAKTLVDWEAWRDRAQAIRADAVSHLPELLDEFEAQVTERGGHVHRAATAEQANATIAEICRQRGARLAVQAKSMTSEETGLHAALHDAGVTAIETDLGEYIVQALGHRPSHILAPAVHVSAVQVAELFERALRPALRPRGLADPRELRARRAAREIPYSRRRPERRQLPRGADRAR